MDVCFSKNLPAISAEELSRLRTARVCVVGCGWLGGYCAEMLARIGVGSLTIIDGDAFTETNMNRQLYCSPETLGSNKALCAAHRLTALFPGIVVVPRAENLSLENSLDFLGGHDLIVDALDNSPSRLLVSSAAAELCVPIVHGAVDGWHCQLALVTPGSGLLDRLYRAERPDALVGSLSFTVSLCASLQVCEAVKHLLGRECAARDRLLMCDLLTGETCTVTV